jgi:peptide/nickel transport system permease protein
MRTERAFAGVALLGVIVAVGPWLWPADPLATDVAHALRPPGWAHPFGTDALGRDVLARVLAAARLDLALAFAAVVLAAPAGALIGAMAGLRGGAAAGVALRGADVLTALPLYLLALLLVLTLGGGVAVVVLATALVNLPFYIRLARGEAAALRGSARHLGALMAGMGTGAIVRRVLVPALAPLVAVQASVNLGWAMLNVAGLSYLGVGVAPPAAEWGLMIADGAGLIAAGAWWVAGFPALALVAAALAFARAGDGLRDMLAPPAERPA